jgi:hypothetical protein
MTKYYLILLILALLGCNRTKIETKKNIGTGQLIPIDFKDSIFKDFQVSIKDTNLLSGWSIKYFVKDDSTKYKDLHIEWSKGQNKGYWTGESMFEVRDMFIPQVCGENSTCIFMTHACASECSAILVLRKDSSLTYKDYLDVKDFSIKYNQILYVTDQTKDDSLLQVALVDLKRNKEHLINFNHRCQGVFKTSYIDTVIFGFDKSIIRANFDNENGDKKIKEQREIKL